MQGKRIKQNGDGFLSNFRYRRKWKRITSVLSIFVVIGTVSSLMLPAITMNQYSCGLTEHTHTAECHSISIEKILDCDYETLGIHKHISKCYDTDGNLICNQVDFVVHTHDSNCFDGDGALVCTLKEVREHWHEESCYQVVETVIDKGHTHSDTCYEWVISETPTCGTEESSGHGHGEDCYATKTELTCTEAESSGHIHGTECYGEDGSVICGQEESTGHTHGTGCYAEAQVLTCGTEEGSGHQHTEECFGQVRGDQICTEEEREPVVEPGEPVLICGKPQAVLHIHEGTCFAYDEDGNMTDLICQEPEVLEHQHTEDCFTQREVQTLICELSEHSHTDECREVELPTESTQESTEPSEETTDPSEVTDPSEAATGETAPPLTEEERRQVDDVILAIDGLPSAEEIKAELERLEALGNADDTALYKEKIVNAVSFARSLYDELPENLREYVTNAERLEEYDFLFAAPDVTLTASGDGFAFAATCPASAFSEGTQMSVQAISADDALYSGYLDQINTALDGSQAQQVWLYDICFTSNGEAVEPGAEVTLRLDFETPVEAAEDTLCYLAVHIGANGTEILPVEPIWEDGLLAGFIHTQSGFSPTAYVAVAPTDNPADNGPNWMPVEYYVYIDGAWTLVGSTKTGWYCSKTASDLWANSSRDHISVDQAKSILGAYGFTGYAKDDPILHLFYQRKNPDSIRLHNDNDCYYSNTAKKLAIPLSRNVLDSIGYNLYYSPGEETANTHYDTLEEVPVPDGSKFFSVEVADVNHLVYGEEETLPAKQVIKNGSTVSVTVKSYAGGWQWANADGTFTSATGTSNADGTVTYTRKVPQKMTLTPKTGNLDGATRSDKAVHFAVWLDGAWTEVGSVETAYRMDGYYLIRGDYMLVAASFDVYVSTLAVQVTSFHSPVGAMPWLNWNFFIAS